MIGICPRCQQQYVRDRYSGDYEHKCFGSNTLANEDILVIGNWEDFTGSDFTLNSKAIQQFAGRENSLKGRPQIEGNKEPGARTNRGFPKNRFRTRQHFEFIEVKDMQNHEKTSDPEEYF